MDTSASMALDEDLKPPGVGVGLSPYPYGLRFCLTATELEKLGYEGLPPAGTCLKIDAVGCVTRSTSEDPDADGDVDYVSVEVQITELAIEEVGESSGMDDDDDEGQPIDQSDRAERMYAKGKQPA